MKKLLFATTLLALVASGIAIASPVNTANTATPATATCPDYINITTTNGSAPMLSLISFMGGSGNLPFSNFRIWDGAAKALQKYFAQGNTTITYYFGGLLTGGVNNQDSALCYYTPTQGAPVSFVRYGDSEDNVITLGSAGASSTYGGPTQATAKYWQYLDQDMQCRSGNSDDCQLNLSSSN